MDTEEIKTVLTAEDKGYTRTLSNAAKALEKIEQQEKKVEEQTEKMAAAMTKADKAWTVLNVAADTVLAGLTLVNEAARKMFATFEKNLPSMYKTVQTAQRLGVSARFVEGYSLAAKKAGISANIYEKALTGVSTALGKAEMGNKKAVIAFNDLGLSWKKLADLDPETRFKAIADAVSRLPKEQQLAAINNLLQAGGVGGSARSKLTQQLAPMFKEGAAGIEKMIEQGDRFGATWDANLEKTIKHAGDMKLELDKSLDTFQEKLTAGLAPAMGEIYETFAKWIEKANAMGDVQKLAESIGAALKSAAGWAKGTAEYIDRIITGANSTDRSTVAEESDRKKLTATANSETSRLLRARDNTNAYTRTLSRTSDLVGMSTQDLKGVADYKGHFGNQTVSKWRGAQAQALLTLQGKMGIGRDTLSKMNSGSDWISVLESENTRRSNKANEAVMKRAGVQQYKYGASTPEHFVGGKENVPLTEAEQKRLVRDEERKKRQALQDQKRAAAEAERDETYKKHRAAQIARDKKRVENAQERVVDIADRKTSLQKEIDGESSRKDRTWHAAERGSAEAYRAGLAYQKADPTSIRQLEEQKKINKEEQKANKTLEEVRDVLRKALESPENRPKPIFGGK